MPRIAADSVAEHRALMMGRLLDAFGDLVHEHGYAGLTLAQVAGRAGMARNTVYNYVGDKEALLMAFIDRAVDHFLEELRAELAAIADPADQLRHLVAKQVHEFRAEPGAGSDAGMVDSSMVRPSAHGELMGRFAPMHDLLAEIVAAGIAEGTFRDQPVDQVVPLAFAVMGAERIPVGSGEHDPDEAAERVTDFLLHALGA
ncbi:MAG: TetR/AcrR family transcriptional regulator [Acidimicrobiales bacterium]